MTTSERASEIRGHDTLPEVCVVVLFWNNPEDTIRCLDSLIRQDYPNLRIVVVNNGSNCSSARRVVDWFESNVGEPLASFEFDENAASPVPSTRDDGICAEDVGPSKKGPSHLAMVTSSHNRGFAAGMNLGVSYCLQIFRPEYFILANNDTIAEVSLISELVTKIASEPGIGAAGPTIEWKSRISSLHPSSKARKFTTPLDQNIPGCFFLVKADALREIHGFDEDFFIFFEETEMFDRLREKGYRVTHVPTRARVEHASSATVSTIGDQSIFHLGRSSMLYWRKQHSLIFSKFMASTIINILIREHNIRSIKAMIEGIISGLRQENRREGCHWLDTRGCSDEK